MANGRGGQRPNAGRPPDPNSRRSLAKIKRAARAAILPPPAPRRDSFDPRVLNSIAETIRNTSRRARERTPDINPFQIAQPMKGVVPAGGTLLAMDSFPGVGYASSIWMGGAGLVGAESLAFLGYPYLSELAQRPEYRIISETIADDATRKWIDFEIVGDVEETAQRDIEDGEDPDGAGERREKRVIDAGKADKVKAIKAEMERMDIRDAFYTLCRDDGFFGRSHLYLDFGVPLEDTTTGNPELKTSVGDGRGELSRGKIAKGQFKGVQTVEPVWTYPNLYNALNPLKKNWYRPDQWYVMGAEVHVTRLLPFIARPVPDLVKPAYSFGGLSLTQIAKPSVDIWLETRQSVADLVKSFSVMVLGTDLGTILQPGQATSLMARVNLFNVLRDNMGLMVTNKGTEEFTNVTTPLGTLDELQAQAQEHCASIVRLPLIKYTGLQPKGLNASAEGEVRVYYDTISAFQNRTMRPHLSTVIDFIQISLFGEVDPMITFIFEPLWDLSQKERSEMEKADAERDEKYVNMGALGPNEVRQRIHDDPSLPYTNIDPDDLPEPPQQPGEGEGDPFDPPKPANENAGNTERKEAVGADEDPLGASDAEWNESDHPRAPDGKFGSGGGSSSGSAKTTSKSAKASSGGVTAGKKEIDGTKLGKTGPQMGSNAGGVFKDPVTDQEFYIKKPASKAHVTNELLGASLYKLAGGNTLDYHPVKGGGHVATELAKLDKKNVNDFTPAEKKAAQKDFAVQAWLGNWDAAGTGGDNQGILNGKPTALDFGGALEYRAQGEPKGDAFGKTVNEITTMTDPDKSPDNAKLYGDMSMSEQKASAKQVTDLTNDQIITMVKEGGGTATLAQKLIDRKASLANMYGLMTDMSSWDDAKHPRNPDGTFAKGTGQTEQPEKQAAAADPDDNEAIKAGAYAGNYVITEGASPAENHLSTVKKVLGGKTQIGIHYRRMLGRLIKDVDKYDTTGKTADAKEFAKAELRQKLANSLQLTGESLMAKGAPMAELHKITKALDALGVKPTEGSVATFVGGAQKPVPAPAPTGAPAPPPAPNPAPAPAPAPPQAFPAPTEQELTKAKKTAALQPQFVPGMGELSTVTAQAEAQKAMAEFNAKYAGKEMTSQPALIQKVNDFKLLGAKVAGIAKVEQQNKVQILAKEAATQAEKNKAASEALKKSQEAEKNKLKEYISELGISETEATAFSALVSMIGASSNKSALISKFKEYENSAKSLGLPISGFQYALIRNYINGGYLSVNPELRSKSMSPSALLYARTVNNAIDKLPKYTGTVTRGTDLPADIIANYVPGKVITEHAFTSTGVNFKFSGNVSYTIKAIGKRGGDFSKTANTHEKEVLFKANTHFLVHKVETKHGVTHIEMEEMESYD